jgi:hypothetical protein
MVERVAKAHPQLALIRRLPAVRNYACARSRGPSYLNVKPRARDLDAYVV